MAERKSARVRRTFTPGFKRDAVAMVHQGKSESATWIEVMS